LFLFEKVKMDQVSHDYFKVRKNEVSQFQMLVAYLGGSTFQKLVDNPLSAYRQLVQQFAKGADGNIVDPKVAVGEANAVFRAKPLAVALSGLKPRLLGVAIKGIPKFGLLIGFSYIFNEKGDVGLVAATGASVLSAPFINPIRLIEKQQRAYLKQTGHQRSISTILRLCAAKHYRPLLRGTLPLMGHSLVSTTLGLVGQPKLTKHIKRELGAKTRLKKSLIGLASSIIISPIYVVLTNPFSRLEVIMQTSSLKVS
jgi:hypothetical protein